MSDARETSIYWGPSGGGRDAQIIDELRAKRDALRVALDEAAGTFELLADGVEHPVIGLTSRAIAEMAAARARTVLAAEP